jgi:3-oxoacyl-[acyl-carrier protein] reductase
VRNAAEARSLVQRAADAVGPIAILVNNAGSLIRRISLRDVTEENWDEVMNLNLKSAVICSQAAAPGMIERKNGAIVNVVSIAGRNGGGPGAVRTRPPRPG